MLYVRIHVYIHIQVHVSQTTLVAYVGYNKTYHIIHQLTWDTVNEGSFAPVHCMSPQNVGSFNISKSSCRYTNIHYINTYIYIYIYTHTHMHTYMYICVCISTYLHIHIYIYIYICIYLPIYLSIYIYICKYINIYKSQMF